MTKATPASSAEAATRWPISRATEVCRTNDCPRSPCTAPFNQSAYWVRNGRSRPISWRTASIWAWLTSLRLSRRRASSAAGSPGVLDTRVKIRNESASSVGTAISSRRMTYPPIGVYFVFVRLNQVWFVFDGWGSLRLTFDDMP